MDRFFHRLIFAISVILVAPPLEAAARVHALFDLDRPSSGPFPSDRFTVADDTQNTGLRIDLPMPPECDGDPTPRPSACADVETLNTLDGFNLQPRLSIPFSGAIDVNTVNFDEWVISAADLRITASGSHTRVEIVSGQYAGKYILLLNTTPFQLATSNVTSAKGNRLLFGANSTALADNGDNSLLGTSGRDFLSGFGGDETLNGVAGADRLDGGLGNGTYIVSSGDVLSDSGGIDDVQTGGQYGRRAEDRHCW